MKHVRRLVHRRVAKAILISALFLSLSLGFSQQGSLLTIEDSCVKSGNGLLLMLPPLAVADNVVDANWSPSGKFLLYHQVRPITTNDIRGVLSDKPENSLLRPAIWNTTSKRSILYPEFQISQDFDLGYFWIKPQDVAVKLTMVRNSEGTQSHWRIHWIIPETGVSRYFNFGSGMSDCFLAGSNSVRPQIVLIGAGPDAKGESPVPNIDPTVSSGYFAVIIDVNGTSKQFPLPSNNAQFKFSKDGSTLFVAIHKYDPVLKRSVPRFFKLNPTSSKLVATTDPLNPFLSEKKILNPSMRVQISDAPLQYGEIIAKKQATLLSSADSEPKQAIVAKEASFAELSSNLASVSFITKGVLQVRQIVPIDLEAYKKAREAAERTKVISQAKQTALALLMFAADHDDTYPSNGAGWMDAVEPYAKNRNTINNFIYTYGGGDISAIENVVEQEIGYVEGPGGRAVAYADGHVKWVPNG